MILYHISENFAIDLDRFHDNLQETVRRTQRSRSLHASLGGQMEETAEIRRIQRMAKSSAIAPLVANPSELAVALPAASPKRRA